MDIIAKSQVRVAPRKVRLVADAIRPMALTDALASLGTIKNRGAVSIGKTLKSAVSNAKNNNSLKEESLKIKSITVNEAPSYKRFHPSTRGRVHQYKRRGSNITIVLTDSMESQNPKVKIKNETKEKGKK